MTKKECRCKRCTDACRHMPGWMVPTEAAAAIEKGLAKSLMLDWFSADARHGNDENIFVLCPAARHRGGKRAASSDELYPDGLMQAWFGQSTPQPCSFLKDDLCSIHESGFKPLQCRNTFACGHEEGDVTKVDLVKHWDNEEGRALVAKWKEQVNYVDDGEYW